MSEVPGGWIVTGHPNRVLRVTDPKSGRLIATMRGPEAQVHLIVPSPDGTKLAVASQDRAIRFFDVAAREQIFFHPGSRRTTTSIAFFSDGTHFVTVAQDNAVQLWDLERQAAVASLWGPAEDSFSSVAVFGRDDHVAVALADGRVRVWGPA